MEAVELYTRIIERHALQTNLISELIALHTAQSEDIVSLSVALETTADPTSETEPCPPPAVSLCFDWSSVEWPAIARGTRVRLDHGLSCGVVKRDM